MILRNRFRVGLLFLGFATVAATVVVAQPVSKNPIDVEGFEQLLPRGRIAAVVDPAFVEANDAEIPDTAWILGYAVENEAYAYDLNLLNSHEVVNHHAGRNAIAAVW